MNFFTKNLIILGKVCFNFQITHHYKVVISNFTNDSRDSNRLGEFIWQWQAFFAIRVGNSNPRRWLADFKKRRKFQRKTRQWMLKTYQFFFRNFKTLICVSFFWICVFFENKPINDDDLTRAAYTNKKMTEMADLTAWRTRQDF